MIVSLRVKHPASICFDVAGRDECRPDDVYWLVTKRDQT
jgi:hypothetical protein